MLLGLALGLPATSRDLTAGGGAPFAHSSTDASTTAVKTLWAAGLTEGGITSSIRLAAAASNVRIAVSTASDLSTPVYSEAVNSAGELARATIAGLAPDTDYHYAVVIGTTLYTHKKGRFRTLPSGAASGSPTSFKFTLGSCWDGLITADLVAAIAAHDPLFHLNMGDSPYLDTGAMPTDRAGRDAAMDARIADDGLALYLNHPVYYQWSDHDSFGDGATGVSVGATARNLAVAWFRDWFPQPLASAVVTDHVGYEFNVGRVRFLIPDCRSDATAPGAADNSSKTRLGAAQKTWLKARLADVAANNRAVILYTEVPWISSSDNDTWFGYGTERAELANHMKAEALEGRVMIVAGDAHMVAVDSGANADYASGGGMDIPVFHAAPMGRGNSTKGGPYNLGVFAGDNNQYGLVEIIDDGGEYVHVVLKAYTDAGTLLVQHAFSLNLTGGGVDATPAAFTFTDVTNADTSTDYVSTVTPTGFVGLANVTVSGSGSWRRAGTADLYTATKGYIEAGQGIDFRVPSSGSASTVTSGTLTVNGVSDTFTVTTAAAPGSGPAVVQRDVWMAPFDTSPNHPKNTVTLSFPAPATAGNIIFITAGSDKNMLGGRTPTSGYAEIAFATTAEVNVAGYWKVATGGENSFTLSWSGTATIPHVAFWEISGATTLDVWDLENQGAALGKTVTLSAGPTTAANALALAVFVNDSQLASSTGVDMATFSWSNGFTQVGHNRDVANNSGIPLVVMAEKLLSSIQTVTTTAAYTSGPDEGTMGFLAVFK